MTRGQETFKFFMTLFFFCCSCLLELFAKKRPRYNFMYIIGIHVQQKSPELHESANTKPRMGGSPLYVFFFLKKQNFRLSLAVSHNYLKL